MTTLRSFCPGSTHESPPAIRTPASTRHPTTSIGAAEEAQGGVPLPPGIVVRVL
jgi:hypothetical protein